MVLWSVLNEQQCNYDLVATGTKDNIFFIRNGVQRSFSNRAKFLETAKKTKKKSKVGIKKRRNFKSTYTINFKSKFTTKIAHTQMQEDSEKKSFNSLKYKL